MMIEFQSKKTEKSWWVYELIDGKDKKFGKPRGEMAGC
jgi:hypothetical protein